MGPFLRAQAEVPAGYAAGKILISNSAQSPVRGLELVLQPYQAVVLELTPQ